MDLQAFKNLASRIWSFIESEKTISKMYGSELLRERALFRTAATVKSVLQPVRERQVLKEVEMALDELEAAVFSAMLDLKATSEHLSTVKIHSKNDPGILAVSSANSDRFTCYLDLPQYVVREEILRNIVDPNDKLRLMEAIPTDGLIMRWQRSVLHLEMIFPYLLNSRVLNWDSIQILADSSKDVKIFMLESFKVLREKDFFDDTRPQSLLIDLVNNLLTSGRSFESWNDFLNPLTKAQLVFSDEDELAHNSAGMMALKRAGKYLQYFTLTVSFRLSCLVLMNLVSACLIHLPNLYFFRLDYGGGGVQSLIFAPRGFGSEKPLPSLKFLKGVKIFGKRSEASRVALKILRHYGQQLHHFYTSCKLETGDSCDRATSLRTLRLPLMEPKGYIPSLHEVGLCTLHKVWIQVVTTRPEFEFPPLLEQLSSTFGDTLKDLTILMGGTRENLRDENASSTWILGVKFPKLKRFRLETFPCAYGLSFLLRMANLEILTLELIMDAATNWCMLEKESIMDLSLSPERMRSSQVWKLMPFLDLYEVCSWVGGRQHQKTILKVTRNSANVCLQ